MATKRVFVVFILPVIFSFIFASVVLTDILQQPGRELNMWPMAHSGGDSSHTNSLEIIGLSDQYTITEPVEIQIIASDSFNCGDLYITIYSSDTNDVVTQSGFLNQCSTLENNFLPVTDRFSEIIDTPGSYKIVADMVSKDLINTSTSEKFTVK